MPQGGGQAVENGSVTGDERFAGALEHLLGVPVTDGNRVEILASV